MKLGAWFLLMLISYVLVSAVNRLSAPAPRPSRAGALPPIAAIPPQK
jgi:hypothetical protein